MGCVHAGIRGWPQQGLATVVLAALAASACSGESEDASSGPGMAPLLPGPDRGGYTGSLTPTCGLLAEPGQSLPSGDVLGVFDTTGCADPAAAQLGITAQGTAGAIAIELEPLEGRPGVFVLRSPDALTSGQYAVTGGAGETQSVVVGPSAPLPLSLGTLRHTPSPSQCPNGFAFTFIPSVETQAYAGLVSVNLFVRREGAGEPAAPWLSGVVSDFGRAAAVVTGQPAVSTQMEPELSEHPILIPRCQGGDCLGAGSHSLTLEANVAGEEALGLALSVDFRDDCTAGPPSAETAAPFDAVQEDGCSAAIVPPTRQGGPWLAGVLALALWRRSRRR